MRNDTQLNPQFGFDNNMSQDNDPDSEKKKKKPFVERVGDWVCIKCKNLNFSFRVVCNRCQLPKNESEKMFQQYMDNLMNYVKINEMMQNQIMNQSSQLNQNEIIPVTNPIGNQSHLKNFVNNNSININNNYYNNFPVKNGKGNIGNMGGLVNHNKIFNPQFQLNKENDEDFYQN